MSYRLEHFSGFVGDYEKINEDEIRSSIRKAFRVICPNPNPKKN